MVRRLSPRAMARFRSWNEMEEMFRRYGHHLPSRVRWHRRPGEAGWIPFMDVYERDGTTIVRAEVPGVRLEDIDISIMGNTLTIKGVRKPPADLKEKDFESAEIHYGTFTRSFELTGPVQADRIEATLENGILEVAVPSEAAQPKRNRVAVKIKSE